MLTNSLKTGWRALSRYKAYSLINVLGLSLGIASCLVIFLVVKYELGYDQFNKKSARIYRITLNALDFNPSVSFAIAPAMKADFPELEAVSQVWFRESGLVKIGDHDRYDEKGYAFADENFTSIFDYQWIKGDAKTALSAPGAIVLTEHLALKYFGSRDAMGQLVKLDDRPPLKVTGIIKDIPGNTHLPFNFLVSFETVKNDVKGMMSQFYAIPGGAFAYIVVPQNYQVQKLQNRIKPFIKKNWGEATAKEANLLLQPLTDIHFDQRYLHSTISSTTSRETYRALTIIAVFIIIIACINFINLATAQAMRRAKEVGVRKVLGSGRAELIFQFLGETAFMVIAAMIIAAIAVVILLPQISVWLSIKINTSDLLQWPVIGLLLGVTTVVIFLAGLYPAFVQSSFKPVESLKSKAVLSFRGLTLRKSLVVVQFAISQIMIAGTLIVAYQMDFFQNRNLGFDKAAVISFSIPDMAKNEVLKQQLLDNPGIRELSLSSGAPVFNNSFTSFQSPELGITKDDVTEVKFVDEKYMDMFGLTLKVGSKIKKVPPTKNDSVFNMVVNETMLHKLGIQDPAKAIGRHCKLNGSADCTIIGVINDFQSESKHKKIRPCALIYRPEAFFMASVRIQSANMKKTIASIDKTWSGLFPDNLFAYEFLDDHIAAWYRQEEKEFIAFKLFSGIAILIGCLGLYGLVAFAAAQRIKEVGIRKVLGASLPDIVFLFSKEFILLILIAFVIAAPAAYYVMNNWLENFAYRIDIGAGVFIITIVVSFLIAGCTIAYQAVRAAVVDPVVSLRAE